MPRLFAQMALLSVQHYYYYYYSKEYHHYLKREMTVEGHLFTIAQRGASPVGASRFMGNRY